MRSERTYGLKHRARDHAARYVFLSAGTGQNEEDAQGFVLGVRGKVNFALSFNCAIEPAETMG